MGEGQGEGLTRHIHSHARIAASRAQPRLLLSLGCCPDARAIAVETALAGKTPDDKTLRDAAPFVEDAIDPIEDFRSSASYTGQMAVVHLRCALAEAAGQAKRAG